MLELEVLIRELFAVDGLSAGSLIRGQHRLRIRRARSTYVAARKVTALKHKVRNDTVELGASVAKALLASAKGAEVLDRLGSDIVEELKVDAARALYPCQS